jgi:hypothetical protein
MSQPVFGSVRFKSFLKEIEDDDDDIKHYRPICNQRLESILIKLIWYLVLKVMERLKYFHKTNIVLRFEAAHFCHNHVRQTATKHYFSLKLSFIVLTFGIQIRR